ncbi:hypothetical protein DXG01_006724 [Tephrocybe rancida]|nr:hypothetical protein DXG01_006724 [Tephrocybe rancida]
MLLFGDDDSSSDSNRAEETVGITSQDETAVSINERFEALNAQLKLSQETAAEAKALLEAAEEKVDGLKAKRKLSRNRAKEKLNAVKAQLVERDLQLEEKKMEMKKAGSIDQGGICFFMVLCLNILDLDSCLQEDADVVVAQKVQTLKAQLSLVQKTADERTASLEAAQEEIEELNSNHEQALSRAKEQLDVVKTQLAERDLQLKETKVEHRRATECLLTDFEISLELGGRLGQFELFNFEFMQDTQVPYRSENSIQKLNLPNFSLGPTPQLEDSAKFREIWHGLQSIRPKIAVHRENAYYISVMKLLGPRMISKGIWTRFTSDFMYFEPGVLRWSPHMVNAIAFKPYHILDNGKWTKEDISVLNRRTFDVFFTTRAGIAYAGTYRCFYSIEWFREGIQLPQDISARSLVNATDWLKNLASNDTRLISGYKNGKLRADCMILEYVGFDLDLYTKLRDPNAGQSLKKRRANDEGDGLHKDKRPRNFLLTTSSMDEKDLDVGETMNAKVRTTAEATALFEAAKEEINGLKAKLNVVKGQLAERVGPFFGLRRRRLIVLTQDQQLKETKTEYREALERAQAAERRLNGLGEKDNDAEAMQPPPDEAPTYRPRTQEKLPKFSRWPTPGVKDSQDMNNVCQTLNLRVTLRATVDRGQLAIPFCTERNWVKDDTKRHLDTSGMLRWGPRQVNAIAFEPFHVLRNGEWKDERTFSMLNGKVLEIFVMTNAGVTYAGTYCCHHSNDWFTEGARMPIDLSVLNLSNATDTSLKLTSGKTPRNKRLFSKYKHGDLRVNCMILEYVGYNRPLHEKLRPNFSKLRNRARSDCFDDTLSGIFSASTRHILVNNMQSIYDDPELAEQMIQMLSDKLKQSKATIPELMAGSIEDRDDTGVHEKTKTLNTKLKLAQETVDERTASLKAVQDKIEELKSKHKLARNRVKQKLSVVKAQLAERDLQLEATKIEYEKTIKRAEVAESIVTNIQMMMNKGKRLDQLELDVDIESVQDGEVPVPPNRPEISIPKLDLPNFSPGPTPQGLEGTPSDA